MPVHEVKDKADFDAKLADAGEKLVVVDFFATWCGPCKMISPFIEEMSDKDDMKDKVVFLKVDVDENEEVTATYKVTAMPTFVFIKNKQKVDEFSGANKDKLTSIVQKHA